MQNNDNAPADAEWTRWLAELVNIDSPSLHIPGVSAIAELMSGAWRERGFVVRLEATEHGPIVTGMLQTADAAPTVLLVGHMDTVFELGSTVSRPFRVVGERAYGPGVADAKGGLVGMLATFDIWSQSPNRLPLNFLLLLNCDEEIGSTASSPFIGRAAERADIALVFEPGRADGSIVIARGGTSRYRIETFGRPAHTGVDPRAGANAIVALSRKIDRIAELTDYGNGLLLNVGVIQGGSRPNIVADFAAAQLDVRYRDEADAQRVHHALEQIASFEDVERTTARLDRFANRPPMVRTPTTQRLVDLYRSHAEDIDAQVRFAESSGGSDGNFTSAAGATTLDAVGPCGAHFHTAEEYLELRSIRERATLTARVLRDLDASYRRTSPTATSLVQGSG